MINIPYHEFSSDARYAFAVGKIRALEAYILTSQQVNRLLEAKDATSLWSELANNSDYAAHIGQFPNPHDYESALAAELKRVYCLVFALAVDHSALDLLALRHDFHNCKLISKAQFLGTDTDISLSPLGCFPSKEWEQLLVGEGEAELCKLPADLVQTAREIQQRLLDEQDLRRRDIIWDQALYLRLFQRAQESKNRFVQTWLKMRIDCLNLMTFVRCVRQKAEKSLLELALISNGLVDPEGLLAIYEEGLAKLSIQMFSTPYIEMVNEGIKRYQQENSFSCLEKLMDDFQMEYLAQARYASMGVEPLFTYLLAKENEIKVLRILLVGKINRLDKNEISKRLRRLYA